MASRPSSRPTGFVAPAAATPGSVRAFDPEDLLGPLNIEEQRFAPKKLFAAGHTEWLLDHPKVSVVGSRRASPEGLKRAAKLARILVEHDVIVVSGLADGIDAAAHLAAMSAGGRTVAVIGTPLNRYYPAKHRDLQLEMMKRHLVVSQFPSGHPTTPKNFPIRNRTMALIVDASVIVEAGEGSDSLSQGWEALRLNRPLFLMASILDRCELSWPKKMLDYGARVLSDPSELMAHLPSGIGDPLSVIA